MGNIGWPNYGLPKAAEVTHLGKVYFIISLAFLQYPFALFELMDFLSLW